MGVGGVYGPPEPSDGIATLSGNAVGRCWLGGSKTRGADATRPTEKKEYGFLLDLAR
jgi:hypothetical protein